MQGFLIAAGGPRLLLVDLTNQFFQLWFVLYVARSARPLVVNHPRRFGLAHPLARNLTHNLAAWLRTRFQVNLVSAEQIQFNEFLPRIPEISYVASVRLEPLGALSVLQLDLGLAPPIIDLLLGGRGTTSPWQLTYHRGIDCRERGGDRLPRADDCLAAGGVSNT